MALQHSKTSAFVDETVKAPAGRIVIFLPKSEKYLPNCFREKR